MFGRDVPSRRSGPNTWTAEREREFGSDLTRLFNNSSREMEQQAYDPAPVQPHHVPTANSDYWRTQASDQPPPQVAALHTDGSNASPAPVSSPPPIHTVAAASPARTTTPWYTAVGDSIGGIVRDISRFDALEPEAGSTLGSKVEYIATREGRTPVSIALLIALGVLLVVIVGCLAGAPPATSVAPLSAVPLQGRMPRLPPQRPSQGSSVLRFSPAGSASSSFQGFL